MKEPRHCDDYIRDKTMPRCLRLFLLINRVPAYWKYDKWLGKGHPDPVLFATLSTDGEYAAHCTKFGVKNGTRVRVVMASRFGDVGITNHLERPHGYEVRVPIECLKDFSETP